MPSSIRTTGGIVPLTSLARWSIRTRQKRAAHRFFPGRRRGCGFYSRLVPIARCGGTRFQAASAWELLLTFVAFGLFLNVAPNRIVRLDDGASPQRDRCRK